MEDAQKASQALERWLNPPTYVLVGDDAETQDRTPIYVELTEGFAVLHFLSLMALSDFFIFFFSLFFFCCQGQMFLPVMNYPCKEGLGDLSKYYKPHVSFLCKHKEWVPGKQGHCYLYTATLRRATLAGHLFEKHRALQRVYDLVSQENASLLAEIGRLRGLLDGATQQEDIMKGTLFREREMRKAAERDKNQAVDARSEIEEQLQLREAEVQQLQRLLQQAAELQQADMFLGGYGGASGSNSNAVTAFRQPGRVGV